MITRPSLYPGVGIGIIFLLILASLVTTSVYQLARVALSPLMVLWVILPLILLPLAIIVLYRIIGLVTARYQIDRDGFYLRWGMAGEQIAISGIRGMQDGSTLGQMLRPPLGFWWPGCVLGTKETEEYGRVEFFATGGSESGVLILLEERALMISPPDPEAFILAFRSAERMGSLEKIEQYSLRPNFVFGQIWRDWTARGLIGVGALLPILMLGYLALVAPGLPNEVPFGFNSLGQPDTFAPPTRLLLIPLIAGFSWLVDFFVGLWFFRQRAQRMFSYMLWATAAVVGALLWGAILALLGASRA
jgi:hypothetical protein